MTGVLKTFCFGFGDGTEEDEEKEEAAMEETSDLPTYDLSFATMPEYSKPDVSPPMGIGFHGSVNWGTSDGEPTADEDTEAPDSDDADKTGGIS